MCLETDSGLEASRWEASDLENVACNFCGNRNTTPFHTRPDGLQAVKCPSCDLCFLNPRPRLELIGRLYDQRYFQGSAAIHGVGYESYDNAFARKEMLRLAELRLALTRELAGTLTLGRCLEVGCATGEFCNVLRTHGAQVTGLDLSSFAISAAQHDYPETRFLTGTVDDITDEAAFDAVFAFEVIEHIPDPCGFLRRVARLVAPGGYVVISTPNVGCTRTLGNDRWLGFRASFEHLFFFDVQTLSHCAESAGFEIVGWKTGGDGLFRPPSIPSHLRHAAVRCLAGLGLLNVARTAVRRYREPRSGYGASPNGHNIVLVLRRPVEAR